jgi:DNA-binding NarL/FixJ family response regulator
VGTEQRIKVLLVDDHLVFRLGMRQLLEGDATLAVVGEADSGDAAIQQVREQHPDVIVMDVRMPEKSGIEVIKDIKAEAPEAEIVIMSAFDDEQQILEALEAGASGYLVKGDDPASMLRAIRNASAGKLYLGPSIAKRVLERLSGEGAERSPRTSRGELSPRETMVLKFMAQGKKNREIAALLGISERTVGNHVANMFAKLRVRDRAQAILYAVRKGIVEI